MPTPSSIPQEARHVSGRTGNIDILTANSTKFIDLARWTAAFFVVADHVRHGLLVNGAELIDPNVLTKVFYVLTSLGHYAVIVFFILSGFLVGGLTCVRASEATFSFRSYFIKRFSRIYTVLVPALFLGLAADLIGMKFFNSDLIYTQARSLNIFVLPVAPAERLSFLSFIDNLFLFQFHGAFGSNGPLWSLAFEWWYYMIFGCALVVFAGAGRSRLVASVALAGMFAVLPFELLLWGGVWLLGTATAVFASRYQYRPALWLAALIAIATISAPRLSSLFQTLHPVFVDAIAGLGFSLLLLSTCRPSGAFTHLGFVNFSLARFSYSLYLTHFPLLIITVGVLGSFFNIDLLLQPDIYAMSLYIGVFIALVFAAFLFSLVTERYTSHIAAWLARQSGPRGD